jgi:glutamate racemase
MGPDVVLVSSDIETANDVYRELTERDLLRAATAAPSIRYEATGEDTAAFADLANRLLGTGVETVDMLRTGAIDIIE